MYRVVDQEAEMRRRLAQLDAKMGHRLAILEAKARTAGSKLPLTRVDAELIAAVRLQRWWRQEMKKRSGLDMDDERWASTRRRKGYGNASCAPIVIPDQPESPWRERFSQLEDAIKSGEERPIFARMESNERYPPNLARIRELRRMYTAQQRIDERLPDPSGADSLVEQTVATLMERVKDDLQPRWEEDGRELHANCARIQHELRSSACRLAAAKALIQSIQEQIAEIERLSLADSTST
ncbi:hypothetical protein BCR44DRAFT_1485474, partial [Catenaria anguillulae PL171]